MEDINLLKYTIRGLNYRYSVLKKINTLLGEAADSADFMDQALGVVMEFSGSEAGLAIIIFSRELRIEAFRADIPTAAEQEIKDGLEKTGVSPDSATTKVLSGESSIEFSDKAENDTEYRKLMEKAVGKIRDLTVIPIKSGRTVIGALELYNTPPLGDDKKEALASIGAQLGVSFEIFRRLSVLKERTAALRGLTGITEAVSSPRQLDAVLDVIINNSLSFFSADGCSILMKDSEGYPVFVAVSGSRADQLKGKKLNIGEGIVGWVMSREEPLLVSRVSDDERFSPRTDSMTKMISGSIICAPLIVAGETIGVVEIVRSRERDAFDEEDLGLLSILSSHSSIAINKARLYSLKERWLKSTVELLSKIIDTKEEYFPGHTDKVRKYAGLIGEELGLSEEEAHRLDLAAAVQDIGKLIIPEDILSKESGLSAEEWDVVKSHPLKSVQILETIEEFREIIPIVKYHHEKYDGSGYPDKLSGIEIPLLARILAVADAYAALTGDRPYREAHSPEKAREILSQQSGTQFDPEIVESFLTKLNRPGQNPLSQLGE